MLREYPRSVLPVNYKTNITGKGLFIVILQETTDSVILPTFLRTTLRLNLNINYTTTTADVKQLRNWWICTYPWMYLAM